jgi:hypothetical protein
LTEYLYTNAALPGSGEDCLNKLLALFAFVKRPALNRISSKVNVKNVTFVYGQNDWMDALAGIETKRICNQMRKEGKHDAPIVWVLGVKDAGHLLMLENWEEFNSAVVHAAGDAQNLPQSSPKPYYHDESQSKNSFFRKQRFIPKKRESWCTDLIIILFSILFGTIVENFGKTFCFGKMFRRNKKCKSRVWCNFSEISVESNRFTQMKRHKFALFV